MRKEEQEGKRPPANLPPQPKPARAAVAEALEAPAAAQNNPARQEPSRQAPSFAPPRKPAVGKHVRKASSAASSQAKGASLQEHQERADSGPALAPLQAPPQDPAIKAAPDIEAPAQRQEAPQAPVAESSASAKTAPGTVAEDPAEAATATAETIAAHRGAAASPKQQKGGFFETLKQKASKKPNIYEEKFKEMEKSFLYLRADFENYKRRAAKERSELLLFGGENFIRALVSEVLDDLDRAYEDFQKTQSLEHFKSGMDLIHKNFQKILKSFQVEAEDPTGKPFDPDRHEALSRMATNKLPKDHVLTTFKKAYTLHNKLIRPAQVVVATEMEETKAKAKAEPEPEAPEGAASPAPAAKP